MLPTPSDRIGSLAVAVRYEAAMREAAMREAAIGGDLYAIHATPTGSG
ncbi:MULTISPECIES: hypothetical protein [unclassified Streptomyces]